MNERLRRLVEPRRVALLAITAAPGMQRLLFVVLLSRTLPIESVGFIGSDLGVASFLSLLGGGALSNQIMASWSAIAHVEARRRILRKIWFWHAMAIVVALPLIMGLHGLGLLYSPIATFVFFLGFSIWQSQRAMLLCERRLIPLAVSEAALFALLTMVVLIQPDAALTGYGAAMLAVGSAAAIGNRRAANSGAGIEDLDYRETGMLALGGLVSTGREMLTVPAIRWLAGEGIAGLVAQVVTAMAALLLIPRALSYHYMPLVAKDRNQLSDSRALSSFQCAMSRALVAMGAALVVAAIAARLAGWETGRVLLMLLAGGGLVAGQSGMVAVSILMVRQRVGAILSSAIIISVVWGCVLLILTRLDVPGATAAAVLLICSIALSLGRARYLVAVSGRILACETGSPREAPKRRTNDRDVTVFLLGTEAGTGRGGISTVIGRHREMAQRALPSGKVVHLVTHRGTGLAGKVIPALRCVPPIIAAGVRARLEGGEFIVMAHPGSGFCLLRSAVLALVAKSVGAKIVWFCHTQLDAYLESRAWRSYFAFIACMSDQLCFLTQYGRSTFCDLYKSASAKACVIANPLPADFETIGANHLQKRPEVGRTILCMTRLVRGKGVDKVIAAMPCLPNYRLLIAGAGEQESDLRQMVDALRLAERVEFRGWVGPDGKEELWGEVDIFCLPSRLDSFGMGFVEALMRGIPVVALNWGGVGEVVSARCNALLDDDEPASIAAAVRALQSCQSSPEHRNLRREIVARKFGEVSAREAYESLYRRLALSLSPAGSNTYGCWRRWSRLSRSSMMAGAETDQYRSGK